MVYVGIDWAESHHDVCIVNNEGEVLKIFRISDTLRGTRTLHESIAEYATAPEEVVIGIETSQGLLARAVISAEYQVYVINPFSASRYRDRHTPSKAKSDPGDATMLAHLVRTDRQNHRKYVPNSEISDAVKVLARAHQTLIWDRQQQVNHLRSMLRLFYPAAKDAFGTNPGSRDALAILGVAPTPSGGKHLTVARIRTLLQKAGRARSLDMKARELATILHSPQAESPELVEQAYGNAVQALVATCLTFTVQIKQLEETLLPSFEQHPDAKIILSLPGLGYVLGSRVLAEFGDSPNQFHNAKARKNFAGTSPITRASGTKLVVLARHARSKRINEICQQWAFCAISASPGAGRLYREQRARGQTHRGAIRKLANRLVGILHGCLEHRELYSEVRAWGEQLVQTTA